MCTGKCSAGIGHSLSILSLVCIVVNVLQFFPDWKIWGLHYSKYVWCMGGILGGGIMVGPGSAWAKRAGGHGCCCNNRCGMLLSTVFAALSGVGAAYCIVISALGLFTGPLCEADGEWIYPFEGSNKTGDYLTNTTLWKICDDPPNAVEWNIITFSILLAVGGAELVLCLVQIINGFVGCIGGTMQKD
ncbi:transmembrane 4 L6 family member 5-like [Lampetra fluviatilis]